MVSYLNLIKPDLAGGQSKPRSGFSQTVSYLVVLCLQLSDLWDVIG